MEMIILRRKGQVSHGGYVPVGALRDVHALVEDLPNSEIAGLPFDENVIAFAEPMPLSLVKPVSTSHSDWSKLTGLATGPKGSTWGIRAVKSDTSPFDGSGVIVAVLDTGIDASHPAFDGVKFAKKNFTAGSSDDVTDSDGHGTHCAGTIFGRDIRGIRIGVAPGVEKAAIAKVFGPHGGTTAVLVSAINWAISEGAHIISMSVEINPIKYQEWLVDSGVHLREATSKAMQMLVRNVRVFDTLGKSIRSAEGMGRSALVIGASGNGSARYDLPSYTLSAGYPGDSEDFISVGAIEEPTGGSSEYRVAGFSNAGVKISAPGVNVLSALPATHSEPDPVGVKSGTSQATPHVAGVAALYAQKLMIDGEWTPSRVIEMLLTTASLPKGADKSDFGRGIVQAPQS